MSIPLIELEPKETQNTPSIKLSETNPGTIWQYMGNGVPLFDTMLHQHLDLNRTAEAAATDLLGKVSNRNIEVELIINPLIPPLEIDDAQLLPIISAIAENASASVEPGPGKVILSTWWRDKYAGVDAVGYHGKLPEAIRDNLMRPGFSTRVADWDTGFGLHAARLAADALAATIELFEPDGSVGFRLAIPIKQGTPLAPPEVTTGLMEVTDENETSSKTDEIIPIFELLSFSKGLSNVLQTRSIEA